MTSHSCSDIFDGNDNYLSDLSSVTAFTAPAGTAYFIVSVPLVNIDTYQVTFGAGEMPYRAYQAVLRDKIKGRRQTPIERWALLQVKTYSILPTLCPACIFPVSAQFLQDSDTSMTVSGYILC